MTNNNGFSSRQVDIEDIKDAISDPDNDETLLLLTEYCRQLIRERGSAPEAFAESAKECAQMLFDEGRYEDVISWLDEIATIVSDEEGPESDEYSALTENEGIEELRLKATDRIDGSTEDDDDDFDYDDDDE